MAGDWGAFVPGPRCRVVATAAGALSGLRFAVKDLIDIAGWPTGCGNPDWARTHAAATDNAPVVEALLVAGAEVCGKTITDELAFSLEGENAHYGTPLNPRCPDRLPGGSSSGSAVAVAAGQCDFALGTDTGGSVRIPASFCGLYGMRPTHGRISLKGVFSFAPSYDCVGWMAASATMLARVAEIVLHSKVPAGTNRRRILLARDVFSLADQAVASSVRDFSLKSFENGLGEGTEMDIFNGERDRWGECYRVLQGREIWLEHRDWIERTRPRFGDAIAARFADLASISDAEVAAAQAWRLQTRAQLTKRLAAGTWIAFPTAPCAALLKSADAAARGRFYAHALAINAIAGHCGLPQITMPVPGEPGAPPLGCSLIGAPGDDEALIAFVRGCEARCR